MASLLEELKRRNVIRVAFGYLVLAWVVLQITDLVAPALRLPEWTLSFVTFIGIVGFPFALFFAWAFELTSEGLKRSQDVDPDDSITHKTAGHLNRIIISLLCVAVIILLADRFFGLSHRLTSSDEPAVAESGYAEPLDTDAADSKPRSIAVLPFVNMSDDREQEYFSDGISEELLNALTQIRELRVAARTSSFAFKGKNQDIKHIGEQLDVETVLEGSVRKSGKRVRITAQLINVDDGYHLWSNSYDRDLVDIFAVQDEISGAIVEALKVHLTDGVAGAEVQSVDIAAYNLYLQARHNLRQRTRDSLELALRQYQQALDIDAQYASAWAGKALATALLRSGQYGDIPDRESIRRAQEYLDTAFAIDPDLGEGHAAQALVYMDTDRCPEALASIERALTTMPNEGILYNWKNFCLLSLGEYRAADEALERAYELDPLHAAVRANWVHERAYNGEVDAIRATTTPGTVEYYRAEWTIAQSQGRWSDMYLLLDELEEVGGTDAAKTSRALTLFFWLGEPEQAIGSIQQHFMDLYRAMHSPGPVVRYLGAIPAKELSPEQRHVLLVALSTSGRFGDIESVVDHLGLESRQGYGELRGGESAFANALHLAWALHEQGQTERARGLAKRLVNVVDDAVAKGLPFHDVGAQLSLLQTVMGDSAAAVQSLREVRESHWLPPLMFKGFYPHFAALRTREDFQQLRADVQAHLDSERQKLGWDTKLLDEI